MSTPDIRVRLSPEGVKEVLDALKTVQGQADRVARSSAGGFNLMRSAAAQLKALLPAIGLAGVTAGFVAMTRNALNSADALDDLSQKVGASAENLSVLQYQAGISGGLESLEANLTRLAVRLGDLDRGGRQAQDAFRRLGLTAADFAGLDTAQAFDLIAQRLGKVEDSTRKTDIAVQIFGKTGAQLMPLLNDLAANGFDNVAEAAASLGLVVDTETAAMAGQVNDSFAMIRGQAQGLALQFVSGLMPSVLETMTSFREETAGKGVDSMRRFGTETGRILRVVAATFRLFGELVAGIFTALGNQLGGFFAAFGAFTRGDFREAGNIWRAMGEQSQADMDRVRDQLSRNIERVVDEATREIKPVEIPVRTRDRAAGATDEEAERAAAAATRQAAAEAARAERESARLAEERRRAEETAGRARFDIEQRLLELTGQQREARLRALDEELAKQRELLEAGGGVTTVDTDRLTRIRTLEVSRIDFEESLERAQQELESLAIQRQRIEQDVELGITTQREGQLQIAEIEAARLPVLQQIAAAALTAAQASGDPALIAQAEQLNLQLGQISNSVAKAADGWIRFREQASQAIGDDLVNWLTDGIDQVDSLSEAFEQLGDTILATLQKVMVEQFIRPQIENWVGSLFGMFASWAGGGSAMSGLSNINITAQRIPGYATGGQVAVDSRPLRIARYPAGSLIDATGGGVLHGPGTGTSDSIPAITTGGRMVRLSSGEGIITARAMKRPGVVDLLRRLNGNLPRSSAPGLQSRFATGGVIGTVGGSGMRDSSSTAAGGMVVNQNFNITSATGSIDRTSQQQVAAAAARGLARANGRNN